MRPSSWLEMFPGMHKGVWWSVSHENNNITLISRPKVTEIAQNGPKTVFWPLSRLPWTVVCIGDGVVGGGGRWPCVSCLATGMPTVISRYITLTSTKSNGNRPKWPKSQCLAYRNQPWTVVGPISWLEMFPDMRKGVRWSVSRKNNNITLISRPKVTEIGQNGPKTVFWPWSRPALDRCFVLVVLLWGGVGGRAFPTCPTGMPTVISRKITLISSKK